MRRAPLVCAGLLAVLTAALAGCGQGALQIRTGPPAGPSGGKPQAVWGKPTVPGKTKGLVLLIPGGGWTGVNPLGLQTEVATSVIFRRAGYETLSVDYRAGAQGVDDVNQFYEQARKRVGPKLPICAFGASAGGQIALMLAVRHPDLRCVVDLAGPTDLPAFSTQPGGKTGYQIAVKAFGTGGLATQSPINYVRSIKAKVLMVYAQNDPIVPVEQGKELAKKLSGSKLIVLPPGTAAFVHTGTGAPVSQSGVSATAKIAASQAEAQFLASSTLR